MKKSRHNRLKMPRKRDYPSVRRFTKKARTKKLRRQFKHVYRSERKRGLSKARSIRAADSVIKRETLRRNPRKVYVIEALAITRGKLEYYFWNDPEQKFTTTRAQASPYKSEKAGRLEARKLIPRLPSVVRSLRVVPQ